MKLWEGLGYYSRARNLKKAAAVIVEEYGGKIPPDAETLMKLPGIGSYTAGAIASIAYGKAVPAVDGNVLRVLSRVLRSREDILKASTKKWLETELAATMPEDAASHFNQGLIEIGAIVCVPNGQPRCGECPLASLCLARKEGLTGEIPVKTPPKKRRIEERTVCLIEYGGTVALNRRKDSGLLASLYELPNTEGYLEKGQLSEAFGLDGERDRLGGGTAKSQAHLFPCGVAYDRIPGDAERCDPAFLYYRGKRGTEIRLCAAKCVWRYTKLIK